MSKKLKIVCDNKPVRINITVNRSLFLLYSFQKEKKICNGLISFVSMVFIRHLATYLQTTFVLCMFNQLFSEFNHQLSKICYKFFLWFIIYLSEIFKPYIFCCVLLLCGFFLNAVIWIIRILRIFKYFF